MTHKHVSTTDATKAPAAAESGRGITLRPPANDADAIVLGLVDGEERIRDTDLAERIGYERPRKIRETIERNRAEIERYGKIRSRPTVGRGLFRGNQATEQEVTEFWLNEGQALAVCALSRTERAADVREEVIRVFMKARRGLLSQQQPPAMSPETLAAVVAPLVAQSLAAALAPLAAKIAALEARMNGPLAASGTVSRETANSIKARLVQVAHVAVDAGHMGSKPASVRAKFEQRIRGRIDFAGTGSAFARMPLHLEAEALRELDAIERETHAIARAIGARRQMELHGMFRAAAEADKKTN